MGHQKLYSGQFFLLCFSSFLFFASFNMIIPELPDYLEKMGGGEYKGLIIALFTLTAGLSRPFSGKLADTVGRLPVMIFGALVCFICGFLYPLAHTVFLFFVIRFFHGLSTGFKPTGTSSYIGDVVPWNRRGEAMGFMGLAGSTGMAFGPTMGSYLANNQSLEMMFYTSSILAIFSVLILARMKETLNNTQPFRLRLLKIKRKEFFEPLVIPPSMVLLFNTFPFGVVLTITPDLSHHVGVENAGFFFTIFTITSILSRFLAGTISDRYGRTAILKIASVVLGTSMIVLAFTHSEWMLITGAVLFGLGVGMNNSTVFAWTIDRSPVKHRGRGMSTMYIALEFGIGMGALISGWIYSNEASNFVWTFLTAGLISYAGLFYLLWFTKYGKTRFMKAMEG